MKSQLLISGLILLFAGILSGHTHAQNSVPPHPVNGEYIKEWLVLGPFFPADLEKDFLADVGGEANIHPKEGNTVATADGKTLTWKRYMSKGNIIDLLDAVGSYENATAYAFCLLQSETTGDARVHLGSDDGVAVWINGKQAHHNPVDRSLTLDEDSFEVNLKAGVNRCLIKVSQGVGLWGIAMKVLPPNRAVISGILTDETGKPILDASVRLEKDDSEIAQTWTDALGSYHLGIYPVRELYNLSATAGEKGDWQLGLKLREGERRKINLMRMALSGLGQREG